MNARDQGLRSQSAVRFAPRIYCVDAALVDVGQWNLLLARCARMGFDHVLLCGDGLLAGLFATLARDSEDDVTDDKQGGIGSMEQLEALAHLCTEHQLRLLLDLSVSCMHPADPLLHSHPEWFAGMHHGLTPHLTDCLPDPRRPDGLCVCEAAPPRLHAPEVARAMLQVWQERLEILIDAGAAGFVCHDPVDLPDDFWCRLLARTREQRSCCHFLAWTPGCPQQLLDRLAGCGFDAVFSSGAWWDFRAAWYWHEHQKLSAIANVLAFPEDPFGPRAASVHGWRDVQTRRLGAVRALRFATLSSNGWLMPMGFEYGLTGVLSVAQHAAAATRLCNAHDYAQACAEADMDLEEEVHAANSAMLRGDVQLRAVSAPDAPVLLMMRESPQGEMRQLVAVNPQLSRATSLSADNWMQRLNGRMPDWPAARDGQLAPGEILLVTLALPPEVAADPQRRKKPAADKMRAGRIAIEQVLPVVDEGRFAVKRIVGQRFTVSADIFMDGHDQIAAAVLVRAADERQWRRVVMRAVGNDRWQAELSLDRMGRHYFSIEAWCDVFGTFRDGLRKKAAAGLEITLELEEGRRLVAALVEQALENGVDGAVIDSNAALLKALSPVEVNVGKITKKSDKGNEDNADDRLSLLLSDETAGQIARLAALSGARAFLARSAVEYPVEAERHAAGFASWYELFPRSQSREGDRHGRFDDVIHRLPAIRAMGFDTLYFPPIHPIGTTHRKGKNNSLTAAPEDPGSPYAIGSSDGGHDAIHRELGTLDDFLRLRDAAAAHGLELALDFAIQCSPDHPWLAEHPGWFAWRPDGSLRYAENPPKKYEDIVNVDFFADEAIPELWIALRDIVLYWVQQGVHVFRVDNPHTKPFPFWEWMIAGVRSRHPQVIFLSEAFTRPKPMYRLAKLGFSQSYTYFTWRHAKQEFIDYLQELTLPDGCGSGPCEYFRPHFFVNTPDINPWFLQNSGRAGFVIRAALAATLSGLWGMYSGFELCEAQAVPDKEEYLNAEKYEIRHRDWQRPGNIIGDITRLNRIRRENPALQTHLGVRFLCASNDNVLVFVKSAAPPVRGDQAEGEGPLRFGDNVILVAINLDPFHEQACEIDFPLYGFGLADDARVQVDDLVGERRLSWSGRRQCLRLHPESFPYGIWRLRAPEV